MFLCRSFIFASFNENQTRRLGIDGSDPQLNLELIRLRNASSVSALTREKGLGALDLASLQKAADVYRQLGLVRQALDMAQVVATDLLPGR